jgi:hypothetical protein
MSFVEDWINKVIKPEQVEKYLVKGKDFIDDFYILTACFPVV